MFENAGKMPYPLYPGIAFSLVRQRCNAALMYQQRLVTGTVVLEAPKLPKDGNAGVFKHCAGSISTVQG